MAPTMKLFYFDAAGRAECARLLLTWADIPFEDVRIKFEDWPNYKAKMPFKAVPVLEVDGKMLAQSKAIQSYVANLAGLLPKDPWEIAKMDEVINIVDDIFVPLEPTFSMEKEERIKVREALVPKSIKPSLDNLSSTLAAAGGKFFGGETVNYADFVVFTGLSNLASGGLDGIHPTILDDNQDLIQFHDRMAVLPAIAKRYAGNDSAKSFRPLRDVIKA